MEAHITVTNPVLCFLPVCANKRQGILFSTKALGLLITAYGGEKEGELGERQGGRWSEENRETEVGQEREIRVERRWGQGVMGGS